MSKHVYSFGNGTADGDGKMKDVLGGKGAGLAEMCRAKLPVPPGFTISTEVCNIYFHNNNSVPAEIDTQMLEALKILEERMGQKLGDVENPLLVSVRSGAKFSMPGMMDTILNLGLNDQTVKALEAKSQNPRFAYDCYRRFIQMYGNVVLEIPKHDFDQVFDGQKKKAKAKLDTELTAADLQEVIAGYKKLVEKKTGKPFPQDAMVQLQGARDAVFRSWFNDRAKYYRKMNQIPDDLGTAVNVQAMVFGNMGVTSATGVGFTRNPATGEKVFYGEFLENAQGEDVVSGVRTPHPISELLKWNPAVYNQLRDITTMLENHYRDIQDFEFTIQDGKLYMLQTRNGKRTGPAAVRIAVDMVGEKLISKQEAVLRVDPQQLDQLLHPVLDPASKKSLAKLATGLPASPGAAVGTIVFTAEDAVEKAKTAPVILVRKETVPDDIHGMEVAKGILTSRGGMTSHAAVVCRGMGTPCVAGAEGITVDEHKKEVTVTVSGKTVTLKEGDWLSLDGSTGEAFAGQANTLDADPSSGVLKSFMEWADEFRGKFGVRANADIPRDAKAARRFGAEGIGLCRTEHMFFAEDRIAHMQAMILARDEKTRRKALAKLLPMQRRDFAGLFEAMNGLPVVIRTLDPPLHEFLPKREDLMVDIATLEAKGKKGAKLSQLRKLLEVVNGLHEFNPMLALRGCRLGIMYPEITEMQARAIFEAACDCKKNNIKAKPEVMIPLVGDVKELQTEKEIVNRVAAEVFKKKGIKVEYLVGTMIELPAGALSADEIAKEAQFFSFGTNDLTQTTFGISRDDCAKIIKAYVNLKIWPADPFAVLDPKRVGRLVKLATTEGREPNPKLKVGICGEHGGDPSSIEFFAEAGLDYVSCSPYRVPIARLAAAQAAVKKQMGKAYSTA